MPVHSSIYNVISSPWMLIAPTIPLLLILINKIKYNGPLLSILVYSVIIFLIRAFTLINIETSGNLDIIRFFYGIEFLISFILLYSCIEQKKLKHPFISVLLVYISIVITSYNLTEDPSQWAKMMKLGIVVNFIFAGVLLLSYLVSSNRNILQFANYWFVSGVLIYNGLLSLLMLLPDDLNEYEVIQFNVIYLIGYFLSFIIISIGIIIQMKIEFTMKKSKERPRGIDKKTTDNKTSMPKKNPYLKPYSSKKW